MAPPPSFSLGLDPRVHTIPATSHGCPDQVRAKRGEGLDLAQTLTLRQAQDEVRDKPNHKSLVVIASGDAARQSRAART